MYKKNSGYTLIEVLVTVAIVAIFASVAVPSFSTLIENTRINAATNELTSNLLLTQSEALKRRGQVTLCPSANQIDCDANATPQDYSMGWIVFLDCSTIGQRDAGIIANCGVNNQEEVIRVGDGFETISLVRTTQGSITFNPTGRPAGLLTFNIGKDAANTKKRITISAIGRVKTKKL